MSENIWLMSNAITRLVGPPIAPYGQELRQEERLPVRVGDLWWMVSNENLLTNGVTIWPARAKTLAIALGPRGTVQEIAERALQYIEQMTPQVEQMRAPCRDPHTLNTIEFTGETYEECERRLVDEDDLPGHRG